MGAGNTMDLTTAKTKVVRVVSSDSAGSCPDNNAWEWNPTTRRLFACGDGTWYKMADAAGLGGGVSSFASRTGSITPQTGDYASFYASLAGSYSDPAWLTSLAGSKVTGSLLLSLLAQTGATTGQVLAWNGTAYAPTTVSTGGVSSFASRTGPITPQTGDYASFYASLAGSYSDPAWLTSLAGSKVTGSLLLSLLAQTGATTGQVLAWNGTTYAPTAGGVTLSSPDNSLVIGGTASSPTAIANPASVPLLNSAHTYGSVNINMGSARIILPSLPFASLPTASSFTNYEFTVTDCLTSSCSAGGGSIVAKKRSNGAGWITVSPPSSGVTIGNDAVNRLCASTGTAAFECTPFGGNSLTWDGYTLGIRGTTKRFWSNTGNAIACSSSTTLPGASAFKINLTGNCTVTAPGATDGAEFTIVFQQDATGSRTVTWAGSPAVRGTMTVSSTANSYSVQKFTSADGAWYAISPGVTGQ
jgi:hypothetical protein